MGLSVPARPLPLTLPSGDTLLPFSGTTLACAWPFVPAWPRPRPPSGGRGAGSSGTSDPKARGSASVPLRTVRTALSYRSAGSSVPSVPRHASDKRRGCEKCFVPLVPFSRTAPRLQQGGSAARGCHSWQGRLVGLLVKDEREPGASLAWVFWLAADTGRSGFPYPRARITNHTRSETHYNLPYTEET